MPRFKFHVFSVAIPCLFAVSCGVQEPPALHISQETESPKPLTVDLGGGIEMEFVLIPKGTFTMGSPASEKGHNCGGGLNPHIGPETLHEVTISKPFYMAKYPVTQEQHESLMGRDISNRIQPPFQGKQLAVIGQGWIGAQEFCKKMRDNDKLGRQFRLPTEAEWEYACRAGSTTAYYFGNDSAKLGEYAWFADNADGRPHAVGEKKPNAWGLFDMHGNIAQWCEDYYASYEGQVGTDPGLRSSPWVESEVQLRFLQKILRGGSWRDDAEHCRAAFRGADGHRQVGDENGFRVVFRPD